MPGTGADRVRATLWVLAILSCALIASACVPGAATPAPEGTPAPFDVGPGRPPAPTPTPFIPLLIDEIVLSTQVSANGAPTDARTALPVNAPVAYLSVLARDVVGGTAFEALWLREGAEIGRSQHTVADSTAGAQWIPLRVEPAGGFPYGGYAVRLTVDGKQIESLAFNSGARAATGPTQQQNPRLVFTSDWSPDAGAINARSTFASETTRVIAVLVNASAITGQDLVSLWYRGDQLVAEIRVNPSQSPSTRTFTLQSSSPLSPGRYQVRVSAGGQSIVTNSFVIEAPAGASTEARVERLVVTTQIDANTLQPQGETVTSVSPPLTLYATALVSDVGAGDSLEIIWYRGDSVVHRSQLSGRDITRNWMSSRYDVPPEPEGQSTEYYVIVRVNGADAQRYTFVAQGPAPVVPTPEPPPAEPTVEPEPEPPPEEPAPAEPAPEPPPASDEPPDSGDTGENGESDD